jgi:predicted transcriptional regulator of viral defense system
MLVEPRSAHDVLWRLGASQRGYFSAAQARTAGFSYQAQRFHVQRGNWLRVDRGIFRFREYSDLPSEENDHLVRWFLWSHGRAVVSHTTALAVHDLGVANPAQIHLSVPPGFRQRDPAVVLHRAALEAEDVEQHAGFLVTTPIRAIAETGADGTDQDVIDSAVADLLNRGMATSRQLLHAGQRVGPRGELAVERALRAVQP